MWVATVYRRHFDIKGKIEFLLLFIEYSVTLVIHVEQPWVEDFHWSQTWGRSL